ncbi:MAG: hypothetical protein ACXABD_22830 [Candidatus Thorarchaeota archaeon]|jgi:hypothetical protein
MASYAKVLLSGCTNGKNINISASGSAGANTIHTAVVGIQDRDEVWIYAQNTDTAYKMLYIMYGGTTFPDDLVQVSIPPQAGAMLVIPGWILNNGNVIKAYAQTANKISVNGFVNRIYNSGS